MYVVIDSRHLEIRGFGPDPLSAEVEAMAQMPDGAEASVEACTPALYAALKRHGYRVARSWGRTADGVPCTESEDPDLSVWLGLDETDAA